MSKSMLAIQLVRVVVVVVLAVLWFYNRSWVKRRFETMHLLPEYFRTVRLQFLDTFWGVGVGAAVPYVIYGLYSLFQTPPAWVNWLAICGALFLGGYYVWREDHIRLIPKFRIDGWHLQPTPTLDQTTKTMWQTIYFQLQPRCSTDVEVTGCRGHLVRVDMWSIDRWINTGLNEAMFLEWSYGSDKPITLFPGAENRLNIFLVHENDKVIHPRVVIGLPFRAMDSFRDATKGDKFRFDVKVTADNSVPVDVSVLVTLGDHPLRPDIELLQ